MGGVPLAGDDGQFAGYRGLARIITPRKLAERRLRESESQLRQLVETIPAAIVFVVNNKVTRHANRLAVNAQQTYANTVECAHPWHKTS